VPLSSDDFIRRIRVPAYLIIAFMSLGSVIEVLAASWPPRFYDVNWRLSVFNSSAGATGTVLLAILILVVVAQLAISSAALYTAFWGSVIGAFGYVVIAGTFVLDSLQVRGRIPPAAIRQFDVTVGWALLRFAFAEVICLWLASCALAAVRSFQRQAARESADPRSALVVGTGTHSPIAPSDA
jgi:hypothetical protein